MNLIPIRPQPPSEAWLQATAGELVRLEPSFTPASARRCAELAHVGTWLLEPDEAASWWLLAIDAASGQARRLEPR